MNMATVQLLQLTRQ